MDFLLVVEIPEAERDPACPKRFRVGLDEEAERNMGGSAFHARQN
jgi:hypothetical protein